MVAGFFLYSVGPTETSSSVSYVKCLFKVAGFSLYSVGPTETNSSVSYVNSVGPASFKVAGFSLFCWTNRDKQFSVLCQMSI